MKYMSSRGLFQLTNEVCGKRLIQYSSKIKPTQSDKI